AESVAHRHGWQATRSPAPHTLGLLSYVLTRMSLFATKSLSVITADAEKDLLKRALGPGQLIALGIGAIIGAGIFTLTGAAAAQHAGPAVTLAFVAAAIGCAFAGICYSEFATMLPIAGSAYTYAYATMGELLAWL